ncbi:MAG TPA: protein phosphatase 2C domain-containing protein [Candidatus Acidoferrales bacterium]|nr:protein phosphatase 2C domain-containing protein [Candidatus Acidoferrales bacterium]
MIEIGSVSRSEQGPRPTNEDRCASHEPEAALLENRGALFAVADGLGGHAGGALASDTALTTLVAHYYSRTEPVEAALRGAVQAANLAVLSAAQREPGYRSMATTLDALLLTARSAYLAHVGDGRVYQRRRGDVRCLTRDHALGRSALTRSLGGALIVRPDLVREAVVAGDRYLLCSDGLWSALSQQEIAEVLNELDPENACATLVELALTHGTDDNATAQIVDVRAVAMASGAAITDAESGGVLRRIAERLIG